MPYSHSGKFTGSGQPAIIDEPLMLKQIAEGDWKAFTELFHFYLPRLSRFIYPFTGHSIADTEEVIQEVFLKIWEKRETLIAIRRFEHYLFRMAKNKVIDILRYRQSNLEKNHSYGFLKDNHHSEPEESLLYNEYYDAAKTAISQLSPKLQSVFLMSTEEELSLDEIASKLSLPKETVKKRLYLACTSIKNYLRMQKEWPAFLFLWIFSLINR